MLKKVKFIVLLIVLIIATTSTVNGAALSNYFDIQSYNEIYKLSQDANVSLPFVKQFMEGAEYDGAIGNSGVTIAKKELNISGQLKGMQAILAADTVKITGSVENAIITASNVVIEGKVEKDIIIIAPSVFITDTAEIMGDIICSSNKIELSGKVDGNFIASSDEMLINGIVEKDLRVHSPILNLGEFSVKNNIYIETNSDINISDTYPNAKVVSIENDTKNKDMIKDYWIDWIVNRVITVVIFVLLYLLIKRINPNIFENVVKKVKKHSSYTILMGTLFLMLLPAIVLGLIILSGFKLAIITVPLLIVYSSIIIIAIILSKFISGVVVYELIKDKIFKNRKKTLLSESIFLGLVFIGIYILSILPYSIGWFITIATLLLSVGVFAVGITKRLKK